MSEWRWEHQGDGRVLRLFQGDREVLVIDKTRLHICDEIGVTRFNTVVGEGSCPTFEDEKLILSILNNPDSTNIEICNAKDSVRKARLWEEKEKQKRREKRIKKQNETV